MTDRREKTFAIPAPSPDSGDRADYYPKKSDTRGGSGYLRSRVMKRSVVVGRHKTSVSLEDVFWHELRAIAQSLGVHLSQLVARIDVERQHGNLSSAIRLFVFEHRCKHADLGEQAAGSGETIVPPPHRHD
jgi:predicted DNA-binding ribbon-helix-helix protein